jgi:hypothetical protein
VTDTVYNAVTGTTPGILVNPARVTWINTDGGDWDTPSNWSTGQVPGPRNAVFIRLPGHTVTHASSQQDSIYSLWSTSQDGTDMLVLSAGSLNIAASSTINNLKLTGGTLSGAGLVTVNNMEWTAGAMTGSGVTEIPLGGSLNITGSSDKTLDTRTLRNTWTTN